jgi:N-acylglucosamine 2-epimerase
MRAFDERADHYVGNELENVDLSKYARLYQDELLSNVLPFWMRYSRDYRHGGYFTCLERDGRVYDMDKFMWLQGREVWCFSSMYHLVEKKPEWLEMAVQGAEFMKQHGRDSRGFWYFSLTADGRPLTQAYNIFSDCFAAMGFAALDKIASGAGYGDIAVQTFEQILARQDDWKGSYNKTYPGTRPMRNFALPMILCNLSVELEHILGSERVERIAASMIHEVMDLFYQPELGLIVENIAADNRMLDSFEGRLLNPGHAIEAMWFIMDLGKRTKDPALIEKAKDVVLKTLEFAWDGQFGGIFYFMDRKGSPTQQLEWDQKLWWVHAEALVASAKGYALTGDTRCLHWFNKVHEYTWNHFRDPEYGEWFGYLNRRGEKLFTLKGGKWKGAFHIPRALYQVWKTFEHIT